MTSSAALGMPSFAAALQSGRPHDARRAAQEFESVFINQLLESLSAGEKTDGPFGGGASEGIYRSMMNDSVAKSIAQRGGLGLADSVYQQILKLQEDSAHGLAPGK